MENEYGVHDKKQSEADPLSSLVRAALYPALDGANIIGTPGDDVLAGTAQGEYIYGLAGNDSINAGAGFDIIDGGAGNDTMDSGAGTDMLRGGIAANDPILLAA